MSKINHNVSDLKYTKFENVLPQFGHINANETSAIEFFYHLKKTKTKKPSDLNDIVNKMVSKKEKNLLLSIIDSNNRRRYLGVKLN